ncbi:MAG TPA: proline racemase family protein [Thermoanaerobaculia bacterium]|nr:proline racemase family protein [Thermoanaerobaculia bacterium]
MRVVDSHTEGEPTRTVVEGWPPLASPTMAGRREELVSRFDALRRAVVLEPRGHEAVVGALLTPPVSDGAAAGVVFFNNVGPLWMCGHGLIGVVRTLQYLGRIGPGEVRIDTPAGPVAAGLEASGLVTIRNVPATCHARDVAVEVPGIGRVTGDVAWGGNWFFLTELPGEPLLLSNVARLGAAAAAVLRALREQGVTGRDGAEIDHVELFGPPARRDADSRNYVLCPGGEYDRSPCGTGTSAKMAALHARGKLRAGERWRQESITGSLFTGWLVERGGALVPHIQGFAYVTGETTLHFDPADPFRVGFSSR